MSQKIFLWKEEDPEKIWRYSLVLLASDIPHEIKRRKNSYFIWVAEEYYFKAIEEIKIYKRENQKKSSKKMENPDLEIEKVFWFFFLLTAVLSLSFRASWHEKLISYGILKAELVKDGDWWRLFTSLFLHQDPPHLWGNMLFGGLFFCFLSPYLGFLRGLLLVLLSGFLGNLGSLFLHGNDYQALGFSTAVFGEIGLLAVVASSGYRKLLVASGFVLALLGFLGSTGKNVDLVAHLTGAFSGIILGFLYLFFQNLSPKI